MFNYLRKWERRIGEMRIAQSVQPTDDEACLVLSGFYSETGYHCGSSRIPFTDVEKLADDTFRMEIARRDIAAKVKELRASVEFAEKALAAEHEQVVRREVLHDELMGRHTP